MAPIRWCGLDNARPVLVACLPCRWGTSLSRRGTNLTSEKGGNILSFEPVEALRASLAKDRRPPDGLLHPSGDLIGSLRHAQLTAAGAPTIESDVVAGTRLMIGTLLHSWLEKSFRSVPVMNEVKLDQWMPEGWTGTADAFFWNAEKRAFVLCDYKSCQPSAIPYIQRDGIKDTHLWQASAYFWAAVRMGLPMVNGFGILYLPVQQLRAKDGYVQPLFAEGTPLEQGLVEGTMAARWTMTETYLDSLDRTIDNVTFVTPDLAPVQDREIKMYLNKTLKTPVIDVKLAPNWSTEFCPFPDELCDCRHQKATKIGHYELGEKEPVYVPRKGIEQPDTIPQADQNLISALIKEQNAASSTA